MRYFSIVLLAIICTSLFSVADSLTIEKKKSDNSQFEIGVMAGVFEGVKFGTIEKYVKKNIQKENHVDFKIATILPVRVKGKDGEISFDSSNAKALLLGVEYSKYTFSDYEEEEGEFTYYTLGLDWFTGYGKHEPRQAKFVIHNLPFPNIAWGWGTEYKIGNHNLRVSADIGIRLYLINFNVLYN